MFKWREPEQKELLSLTHPQKRIWYSEQMNPGTALFNIGGFMRVKGDLDPEIMDQTAFMMLERNPAFRLRIVNQDGQPMQYLRELEEVSLPLIDLSGEVDPLKAAQQWMKIETGELFPKDEVVRGFLLKLGVEDYVIYIKCHHIIADGWTYSIIAKELDACYHQILTGVESVEPVPASYLDYLEDEAKYKESKRFHKNREFWIEHLEDVPQAVTLSSKSPTSKSSEGKRYNAQIGDETALRIKEFVDESGTSVYTFFMTVLYTYLYRVTGEKDLIISTPVLNRSSVKQKGTIGMFVSTMPFRVLIDDEDVTFADFQQALLKKQMRYFRHQQYPIDLLIQDLGLAQKGNQKLFQIALSYQNSTYKQNWGGNPIELGWVFNGNEENALTIHINERNQGKLELDFDYAVDAFDERDIQQIAEHFLNMTTHVLENKDLSLREIEYMSPEERERILYSWNDTDVSYPSNKCVYQLFEEQVEKTPDQIAVRFGEETLTYSELNRLANQLATELRELGVQPDQLVGILMDRSLELMVGIMGVLKAGGAYVPIDPSYPEERCKYMLDDSQSLILLTQSRLMGQVPGDFAGTVLELDHWLHDERYSKNQVANLEPWATTENLCYIIYTSGSTGKPKGVMVEHGGLTNYIWWAGKNYVQNEQVAFPLFTSISFDLTVTSIFTPLTTGNTVIVYEGENKELLIETIIQENQVGVVKLTPSHLKLIRYKDLADSKIKRFILGGEELERELAQDITAAFKGQVEIYNEYGPTETTVGCMIYKYDPEKDDRKAVPIGVAAENVQIYILDSRLQPVPIGVSGEIFISGDGVARGYLNRPEMTAEKFIDHPFIPGKKMYRTGDLAKWLPDGKMEFLGRIDHQVKIRGNRIELTEIEAKLLQHEEINETLVMARADQNGDKYLCAYLIAERDLTVAELREYLLKELPGYMVPSYFIQIDQFILTQNGKIDRTALPKPDGKMNTGVEYVAPANDVEEALAQIWSEVLGVEKIGVYDNFFELGGHSLKATTMISRVHKILGTEITLRDVFDRPTIRGLATSIDEGKESIFAGIEPVGEQEVYPVSSAQKRLLLIHQMESESLGYNMPGVMVIEGDLELNRLENAFQCLIQRHETLRTSFEFAGEEPVQRVHQNVDFRVDYRVSDQSVEEMMQEFVRPFDLGQAPLLRVGVREVQDQRYIFLFDMHHIISDGISVDILIREFVAAYEGEELPELKIQYKDFSAWQNQLFQSDVILQQAEYWQNLFADEIPVLNLPTDYPRPAVQSFAGDQIQFELDAELTAGVKRLAAETGSTLYMTLLAAYNALIFKYTGQEDLVIGSPIAGRPHDDLKGIIGMFVNTLAMRNYPAGEKSFVEFLNEVKESALKAYENQDYQFEALVEKLNIRRDLSRNPLFDIMFVLQNMDMAEVEVRDLTFKPYDFKNKIAKFDLTLTAVEAWEKIQFEFEYATKLFKAETIQRMAQHFINLLQMIVSKPRILLQELDLLQEAEREQLLYEFNQTDAHYPQEMTLHQLFEKAVEQYPERIALVYEGEQMTYLELNEKANQLARKLRAYGVQPDTLVGMLLNRSNEMIIGIMAILKAGGAYLPIDPDYPADRIEFTLEDSGTQLLLTTQDLVESIQFDYQIFCLDDQELYQGDLTNLESVNQPQDLAYIIYTSGTTGRPKGVMIEHRNVVRLLFNDQFQFEFSEQDTWTMFHSYCFDFSVWEMYGALLYGGRLIVIPKMVARDPGKFLDILKEEQVTVLNQTPSAFYNLINEELQTTDQSLQIRYVVFGGEALNPIKLREWKGRYPKTKLINMYGITETTVHVTFKEITDYEIQHNISNIGRPIPTLTTYVMDQSMKILPIGVPGELCVGGDGVARGYLNRPELTATKFVPNPYKPAERMYRSGDLVRMLNHGEMEYLGRIDHQVKIRGFRIELGEIESRLLNHPELTEAIVLARENENGDKYLCAYFMAEQEMVVAELRKYLSKDLPDYMIPAYFIQLEEIPLTGNGKVNRKALPEPDQAIATGIEYVAPTNEVEDALAQVWQDVLGVKQVGINDNFFALGGDSIKAIQISSRLQKYNLKLEVQKLFQNPTIAELSDYVQVQTKVVDQSTITGDVPLTPIQYWFFGKQPTDQHHYNQSVLLLSRNGFNLVWVREVFNKLVEHHDGLRMIYQQQPEKISQFNRGIVDVNELIDLKVYDLCQTGMNYEERIAELAHEIQGSMDLAQGPLVKLGLFQTEVGDYLLIAIHHLVVDGVSWRIIFEDFATGYQQLAQGEKVHFPLKTTSYQEWAQELEKYSRSEALLQEMDYWRGLASMEKPLPLPRDRQISADIRKDSASVQVSLTVEETEQLLKEVHTAYNTEINDLLLAGLAITLQDWAQMDQVWINLEGHGREEIIEDVDINRTIGWFTSIYPVVFKMTDATSSGEIIKGVKETLRAIPNKGVGYGILKYLTPAVQKADLELEIRPEISFNYLGQFDQEVATDLFEISELAKGYDQSLAMERFHTLDIVGIIKEGRLVLTVDYNQKEYEQQTMTVLMNSYLEYLRQMIAHCLGQEDTEFTLSDFSDQDLDEDELEDILDDLEDLF